jgi:hypothetical protein
MNETTRRGFIAHAISAGCAPWISASFLSAQASSALPAGAQDKVDTDTALFWQQLGTKNLDRGTLSAVPGLTKLLQPAKGKLPEGAPRPVPPPPPPPDFVPAKCDPNRLPVFFYLPDPEDSKTWRPAYQTKRDALLEAKDPKVLRDLTVKFVVNTLKLAQSDNKDFGKIVNGSLRVDLEQTQPISQLVENLVWSSIGAVFPKAGGVLPQVTQLNFNAGTSFGDVQTVPLPGGSGTMLWQFFVEPEPSGWSKLVEFFRKDGEALAHVAPLLGLPGIAVTAFSAVNNFISKIPHVPKWLFQQCDKLATVTTKSAFDNNLFDAYLPLVSGRYMVVPAAHVATLQAELDKGQFTFVQGRMVPKNQADKWDIAGIAESTMPDVTYVTMNVVVTLPS